MVDYHRWKNKKKSVFSYKEKPSFINKDVSIKKIILGTVQFGLNYGINNQSGKISEEQSFVILNQAYRSGIERLDTSDNYGNAIKVIGRYHHASHKIFKILNKFSFLDNDKNIVRKVDNSLKILGINIFDVYSYHSFKDFIDNHELQGILMKLKKQKLINKIGISVYSNQEFEIAINSEIIDVIQIPYNIFDNYNKRGVLIARAKHNGKEIHIRSIFLQGLFFLNERNIFSKLRPLMPYLRKIKDFCKKQNISVNELALTYAISNPDINGVLIGVDSIEQLTENLNCLKSEHTQVITKFVETLDVKETELLNPVNWK